MKQELEQSLKDFMAKSEKLETLIKDLDLTITNLKTAHPAYGAIQKLEFMHHDLTRSRKDTLDIIRMIENKLDREFENNG